MVRLDSGRRDAGPSADPALEGFRATGISSSGCPTSHLPSEEGVGIGIYGLLEVSNPTAEPLSVRDAAVVLRVEGGSEQVLPVGLYHPRQTVVALEEPVLVEPETQTLFVFQIFTAEGQRTDVVEGAVAEAICAWTCEDARGITRFDLESSHGRLSADFEMDGLRCGRL